MTTEELEYVMQKLLDVECRCNERTAEAIEGLREDIAKRLETLRTQQGNLQGRYAAIIAGMLALVEVLREVIR